MKLGTAFLGGLVVANALNKAAMKWIWSDGDIPRQTRMNVLAQMDHLRLLRTEEEVQDEIIRRAKRVRKEKE